ncbi:MAG: hypothetical protein HKN36_04060 [Hellea sp.]|nr:hypothetical protein [Hellea sp.]
MRDLRVRFGFILALALLPLLIFEFWRSSFEFKQDQRLIHDNTELSAQLALSDIYDNFETTRSVLKSTASVLAKDKCNTDLSQLTKEYPKFHNLIYSDSVGEVLCAAKPVRSQPEQAPILFKSLSPETPFNSVVFSFKGDETAPERVIATAYGVYSGRELSGVFVAVEDISFMHALLQNSRVEGSGNIAVFDPEGEILIGDWDTVDMKQLAKTLPETKFSGNHRLTTATEETVIILPTPSQSMFLATSIPDENIVSWNLLNPFTSVFLPLLAWVFGFFAIWLATDQLILAHLRRMQSATLDFAKGNKERRIGKLKNPPRAILTLGKNFDLMADKISEREVELSDSLDEKEILLREIHHRVKNNLQIIISLLNMQERKLTDQEGLTAIIETRNRINAIALVHRGLYESQDLRYVDMQTFLDRLIPELSLALAIHRKEIFIETQVDCLPMEADTATPIVLFIVEALTNSVKHGVSEGGTITISINQKNNHVTVAITDTGNSAAKNGVSGTGTKLMNGFARQLGGKMNVKKSPEGYTVSLSFKLRKQKALK